jgi:hypothetical protein
MGAALTYARRYALFALVGIAGEDDLDAPDLAAAPNPPRAEPRSGNGVKGKRDNGLLQRPSLLSTAGSAELRDAMLAELASTTTDTELLAWAKSGLLKKNTLQQADAQLIETAYREKLSAVASIAPAPAPELETELVPTEVTSDLATHDLAFPKESRKRSKAHLLFVRGQPCVVCKQSPCDAHHLKFAQPKALGRKVSDQFTVPLCRTHHQDLHRNGNEKAWWANMQIAPLPIARELWQASPIHAARAAGPAAEAASIVGSESVGI